MKAIAILYPDYNWIAFDSSGETSLYKNKPIIKYEFWDTDQDDTELCLEIAINPPYCKEKDWKKSLRRLKPVNKANRKQRNLARKYAKVMKAFANGAVIETRTKPSVYDEIDWSVADDPIWNFTMNEYRIKK